MQNDRTPSLRLVRTEEDAVREALARAIDAGRDAEAAKLLERLRRMACS